LTLLQSTSSSDHRCATASGRVTTSMSAQGFIGCECHSGSNSSSPCLPSVACTPPYLARELRRVADMDSRRRLRSASTLELNIPSTRRVTVADRAFAVAAACVWNGLPSDVTASPSLCVRLQATGCQSTRHIANSSHGQLVTIRHITKIYKIDF